MPPSVVDGSTSVLFGFTIFLALSSITFLIRGAPIPRNENVPIHQIINNVPKDFETI